MTDITGHGTKVASVAAGKTRGVASKANLVVVKFKNSAKNPLNRGAFLPRGVQDGALEYAFNWVINDIYNQKRQGNAGKFVVNLSYGMLLD